MQQIAESHYGVGHGNQQEVLKAQLQHTKILQEITMSWREEGELEAQLKQLLDRDQDSADIVTEPLARRAVDKSFYVPLMTNRINLAGADQIIRTGNPTNTEGLYQLLWEANMKLRNLAWSPSSSVCLQGKSCDIQQEEDDFASGFYFLSASL
jgi:hypothetical protein